MRCPDCEGEDFGATLFTPLSLCRHGITPTGSCSHIEILDNYIHDIQGHAIRWYNHDNSYVIVRGNEMYLCGCPSGISGKCTGNGWAVQMAKGHHNLVEYNTAHRVGDFINVHTPYTIVRNNYLYDFQDTYWPDGLGSGLHCDMFQPCGSTISASHHQIYESNFMGDNQERNSHILQMRRTAVDDVDHHIIFRGNVGYNHGSYAMQCGGIDNVYLYNNTLDNIAMVTKSNAAVRYNKEGANTSLNNLNFNNIYSRIGAGNTSANLISVDSGSSCISSNNLGYLSASHASLVSTADPLFEDTLKRDYHLQSNSPAVNRGKPVATVTSLPGSGVSFNVDGADLFCDGYGITEGDIIAVGTNDPVHIIGIESTTITVDRTISWDSGSVVRWRNQDTSPEIGAYEYCPGGYDFSIAVASPKDDRNVNGAVTITTTAENPNNIRFVVFYIDGIPVTKDTKAPFSCVWNSNGEEYGSRHTIESRAYALYASKNLFKSDTVHVVVGTAAIRKGRKCRFDDYRIIQQFISDKCIIRISSTTHRLPRQSSLCIHTSLGTMVDELVSENGAFIWNIQSVPPGMYIMTLKNEHIAGIHRLFFVH